MYYDLTIHAGSATQLLTLKTLQEVRKWLKEFVFANFVQVVHIRRVYPEDGYRWGQCRTLVALPERRWQYRLTLTPDHLKQPHAGAVMYGGVLGYYGWSKRALVPGDVVRKIMSERGHGNGRHLFIKCEVIEIVDNAEFGTLRLKTLEPYTTARYRTAFKQDIVEHSVGEIIESHTTGVMVCEDLECQWQPA